ncbi:MAG TPA: AtpZ/AtpI family protein [Bacteroidales bacterium]|nr:AtpZ/AtpI family protein [Bacteroidales bacterium]
MEDQHQIGEEKPKKPEEDRENSGIQSFARYSGMAMQMIVIIGITTWCGVKLDERFSMKTPVFTIILSLIGVFAALYTTLRDFIKK